MSRHQRPQHISQQALRAELRPRDLASFVVARAGAAVTQHGLAPVVDAQCDAGEDVGGDRGGEEERLEREGLVVGPGEEEVGFRGRDRARQQWDERRVGVVKY